MSIHGNAFTMLRMGRADRDTRMALGIDLETKRANRDQKEQPDETSRHHQGGWYRGREKRRGMGGVDDANVSSRRSCV